MFELFIRVRRNAKGPDLENLCVKKGLGVGGDIIDQGADKVLGLSAACPDEYPVPSVNVTEDLALRGKLVRIATLALFKTHAVPTSSRKRLKHSLPPVCSRR